MGTRPISVCEDAQQGLVESILISRAESNLLGPLQKR